MGLERMPQQADVNDAAEVHKSIPLLSNTLQAATGLL